MSENYAEDLMAEGEKSNSEDFLYPPYTLPYLLSHPTHMYTIKINKLISKKKKKIQVSSLGLNDLKNRILVSYTIISIKEPGFQLNFIKLMKLYQD